MRIKRLLAIAGLCLVGLLGTAHAGVDAEASKKCMKCHDEDLEKYAKSAHAISADPRTPTCVTCHGASAKHVAKSSSNDPEIMYSRKSEQSASERSAVCLSCHDKDASRNLWPGSPHQGADLACNSCHKVHEHKDRALVKATQPNVCYSCHKEQRVQVQRPSHHPIPEGKMTCSDCHAVHGSSGPKLAKRDSTNDTCFLCHAEKRGPFVHPHQPATEDCATCHNAHGSTVAAMLKVRPPMLCQQCHTPHVAGGVGALGGQAGVFSGASPVVGATANGKNVVNLWQGRSCMNCHTQVHGSNNPSATNPTPQYLFR